MKIKDGFILREVAGSFIIVPTGKALLDFNGMITLNKTGAFIWDKLEKGSDEKALASALASEYGITEEEASKDVFDFLRKLEGAKLLESN